MTLGHGHGLGHDQLFIHDMYSKFLTQVEMHVRLSWQANPSDINIISYNIFRDSLNHLIGTVPACGPLRFTDHNLEQVKAYTYFITAVDANGNQSPPAIITVRFKKRH